MNAVVDLKQAEAPPWPEPQPLIAPLEPVEYPLDALPAVIRDAVAEVQGFVKAPVPMVAGCALSAVSLAGQALADVQRAVRLSGPCSLYLLTLGESGERKSTCDGFFTRAIQSYERLQADLFEPDIKRYKAEHRAWKAKRDGLTDRIKQDAKQGKPSAEQERRLEELEANEPQPPLVPELIRGDDTPEALAWGLAKRWPSQGVVSSEAGVIFGSHGMGKDSVARNLGLLNVLWDGGTLSVGRKTSDSFKVEGARFTSALQVQAAVLKDYFDKNGSLARGSGYMARFLICWPRSTQGHRPFSDPPDNWPALARFNQRIEELLNLDPPFNDGDRLEPPALVMHRDSKAVWVKYHDDVERELSAFGELVDVRDVASKSADNAARMACLFHLLEHGPQGCIGVDAITSGCTLAAWYLNESRRFFGELALPENVQMMQALDAWLLDYCRQHRTDAVPRREVQRCAVPANLRRGEVLDVALEGLTELGRARLVQTGRRKDIALNPALLEGVL